MLMVRCTQRLLHRLPYRPSDPWAKSTTKLGDWCGTFLSVGRRRFLLLISERARLPVLLSVRDADRLPAALSIAVSDVLKALGVSPSAVESERQAMTPVKFGPTNSRSLLGSLNEFAFLVRVALLTGREWSLLRLAVQLAETPLSPLKYECPSAVTRRLFASKEGSSPLGSVSTYEEEAVKIRPTGGAIYRLKVTLRETKPPIWRRFLVPGDIPLKRLHDALQTVMGWTNSHLHQFEARGVLYGTSDREFGMRRVSEGKTRLEEVLRKPKDRMTYEYDFGDSWEHDIVLEEILRPNPEGQYPLIVAGERACPPEDVGGIPGYYYFLEVLADPKHPEHKEMLEWIGGAFDPEGFDVQRANLAIHGGWVRKDPNA